MGKKNRRTNHFDQLSTSSDAVLVTGGSGFIGRAFVKKLAESDRTVVSMYRHRLPEPMPNVYPVCSDLESVDLLKAPLRGVETVVYLAWENSTLANSSEACSSDQCQNVKRLGNLIEAMEAVGTKRMIFVSANGASRLATSDFLREKYQAEFKIVNSSIPQKIVVRPTIVSSGSNEHDKFIESIVNITKFPGIYPVPRLRENIAPINLYDFCKTLMHLLTAPMQDSLSITELVGEEGYSIEEVFRLVSEKYTRGTKLQIKGKIGNSLVPIFEGKDSKFVLGHPRIKHYLTLGHQITESVAHSNPVMNALPKRKRTFKESLR